MRMAEVIQDETKAHYLGAVARVRNGVPSRVKEVRAAGLRAFEETPLPHTRMEEWRQTNLSEINRTAFLSLTEPTQHGLKPADVEGFFYSDGAWTELVFVDGFFAEGLSRRGGLPEGVVAGNMKNAMHGSAQIVEQHLGKGVVVGGCRN